MHAHTMCQQTPAQLRATIDVVGRCSRTSIMVALRSLGTPRTLKPERICLTPKGRAR
jgi:hypothetical protein